MASQGPPSYDEVVGRDARPAGLQDEVTDGMPLLFRDGPLEIAMESMEAAPAWRESLHSRKHGNSRAWYTWGITAALMLTFMVLSFSTANRQRSAPEALNTVEAVCPSEVPTEILPQISATATVYDTTLTLTRSPDEPATSRQPFYVSAETIQRLVPQQSTHCLAVRVPPAVRATLQHIYLTPLPSGLSPGASSAAGLLDGEQAQTSPQLCVCTADSGNAQPDLPPPHPSPSGAIDCPLTCADALQPMLINSTDDVYRRGDWYRLLLPEKVEGGRELELTWLSRPRSSFAVSAPYAVPACASMGSGGSRRRLAAEKGNHGAQSNENEPAEPSGAWLMNVSAPACSPGVNRIERALISAPPAFMPDVLASGGSRAGFGMTLVMPSDVQALWATAVEHWTHNADNITRTTFKRVRWFNGNMLTLAVGRFRRLATTLDAQSRRFSVWALPGAVPSAAQLPLRVLSRVLPPWERLTGQPLPQLGKLDMLVWDGESPWSSASFGLLWMDRFRTLFDPAISTASDLVRAAHIICHESGHHWFGGVVQTLTRERGFIEESTTSYGEVACVAAALPSLNNSAIYREMFAPPFQDSRGIHIGALFHALEEFTRPGLAHTGVDGSIDGRYAKGAAFLHMMDDYLEDATGPGSMHALLTSFVAAFRHQAATADTLLCHFAAHLASLPIEAVANVTGCAPALLAKHLSSDVDSTGSVDASSSVTNVDEVSVKAAAAWLERLRAWLTFPGVPVLQLAQAPSTKDSAGDKIEPHFLEVQLTRAPSPWLNGAAMQPVWVPVAMTASQPMSMAGNGTLLNSTTDSMTMTHHVYASRWTEINPVSAAANCSNSGVADNSACQWQTISAPLQLRSGLAPYLSKARASGPFVVLPDGTASQAKADVEVLKKLKLHTLTKSLELLPSSGENQLLRGYMHLINDRRLQVRLAPESAANRHLLDVAKAAAHAPAATQSGLAAYALLSPVADTLENLQLLARGDNKRTSQALKRKSATLAHAGGSLWYRALKMAERETGHTGVPLNGPLLRHCFIREVLLRHGQGERKPCVVADAVEWGQNTLFTMIVVARIAPAAAVHNHDIAAAACKLLPSKAKDLQSLKHALALPPDLENVIFEIAVARGKGCEEPNTDVAALLLKVAKGWVKEARAYDAAMSAPDPEPASLLHRPPLHQHDRRSIAFILASSVDPEALKWLATKVALEGGAGGMGLRVPDRVALLGRMTRQSTAGFDAVRQAIGASHEKLTKAAKFDGNGSASWQSVWDREEAQVLQQALTFAVPVRDKKLPAWAYASAFIEAALLQDAASWLQMEHRAAETIFPI